MSWTVLLALVVALGVALFAALSRRLELRRMRGVVETRERLSSDGAGEALLRHPVVDLSRCLGCGTCVAACPEEGVLELVHGQAQVVLGSRCVGHRACERECPVGAITVTIAKLEERRDIPVLEPSFEAVGAPGVFLAGEATAHALIKVAIEQGTAVAGEVARRCAAARAGEPEGGARVLDLVVVGAGPAGLACSLEAKRNGLDFVTLDREQAIGGTVAQYPRQKLVLTAPVELPLYGRLSRASYTKEELVSLWREIAEQEQLPVYTGTAFEGLERDARGHLLVRAQGAEGSATIAARNVCLAIGRRGSPRKLGVPGEDLPKVAYSLLDAGSFQGRRILVVGGGDSAVEAALGLAEQPGNQVALSYRKAHFFRLRARNAERLEQARALGRIAVLPASEVRLIAPDLVGLSLRDESGAERPLTLANDDVFVLIGGTPPTEFFERAGVSCDPALREQAPELAEQGTGALPALTIGFALALGALIFALWNVDYYALPLELRPTHAKHDSLRPGLGQGLALGFVSGALVLLNLAYLLRRSARVRFQWGSLRLWMTSHVATGILAFLCALLHAAMAPRHTLGGHAFWALSALVASGAIGRYFYAWVPRAANGRELELAEVKARLGRGAAQPAAATPAQAAFQGEVRRAVLALIEARQWKSSLASRVLGLFGLQLGLRRALASLAQAGRAAGVPAREIEATLALARAGHRSASMVAHFEDLRALLNGWRYLHRWMAVLMVLLVGLHVVNALVYGSFTIDGDAMPHAAWERVAPALEGAPGGSAP